MNTRMTKRKLCPFCGWPGTSLIRSNGRKFINGLDHPIHEHKWYVRCNKCNARGPIASGKVNLYENNFITPEQRAKFPEWQTTDDELIDKAVSAWNRSA